MSHVLCPHCGQYHRSTAKFCPSTGQIISTNRPTPPPAGMPANFPVPSGPGLTGRLPPNAVLNNRFAIITKIGQGGMAAVYQASDIRLPGKVWAIKEMSESAIPDPQQRMQAVQAFQQEAELLAKLSHRNLPQVIDSFSEGGRQYLVMEYVQGQTLETILAQRQAFTEAQILPWVIQLCDVLYYLHSQPQPIIFRDLKPSNIMVTPAGQIKLIDFGIVRFFKPGKTKDTTAIGTMGYCAPEATSDQTDGRSDIYSLCVVIHELLTRHDPTSTIWTLPPVRQINSNVSREWEQILQRGLEQDRHQRWPDAKTLGEAFVRSRVGQAGGVNQPAISPPPRGGVIQPVRTSRPTTRLIMAAAQLSTQQLAAAVAGITVTTVIGLWVLTPILRQYPLIWDNFAAVAMVAPFAYAAVPRHWVASIAHIVLSIMGGLTIVLRVGGGYYNEVGLFIGALVSAGFIEIWLRVMPKIKSSATLDTWKRELGWLAGMAVIATSILYQFALESGFSVLLWLSAALMGALGWFMGDLAHQYLENHPKNMLPRP